MGLKRPGGEFEGALCQQAWVTVFTPSISTLYQDHLKLRPLPKTDTTSAGNVGFDHNISIPLTLITFLVTASFNIPRLASISVSQSRARVMPV
ncbi:hypothetical protein [Vreelandella titanicae]|uniref:hypothetical protein n=1 Tax=Vreelandella titanicae TaxID=664683 RepID=UPI0039BF41B1